VQDLSAFLQVYASGDLRADADNDGRLTVRDFSEFLRAYVAGQ